MISESRKKQMREASARWRAKNRAKIAALNRTFYARNREGEKQRAQDWRARNKQRAADVTRAWRENNKERFKEIKRAWRAANAERAKATRQRNYLQARVRELELARLWKRANPAKCLALAAKRKAAKLRAIPAWTNLDEIEKFYERARNLSAETGIPHHVDHIYPLQSKIMCGLHVETNLQILTAAENQSKSNRKWPEAAVELRG